MLYTDSSFILNAHLSVITVKTVSFGDISCILQLAECPVWCSTVSKTDTKI